jgi:DNA polymerase III gamma/tau subunit
MGVVVDFQVSQPETRQQWADRIKARWQETVEGVLDVAAMVREAHKKLGPTEWTRMIEEDLRWSTRMGYHLKAISEDKNLVKHASQLPSSWYTIYLLTHLTIPQFQTGLDSGIIHPGMVREDVKQLTQSKEETSSSKTEETSSKTEETSSSKSDPKSDPKSNHPKNPKSGPPKKEKKTRGEKNSRSAPKGKKVADSCERLKGQGVEPTREKVKEELEKRGEKVSDGHIGSGMRVWKKGEQQEAPSLTKAQEKELEKLRLRLEAEFQRRVRTEIQRQIEQFILPSYKRMEENYKKVLDARKGIMTKEDYQLIRTSLHPERFNQFNPSQYMGMTEEQLLVKQAELERFKQSYNRPFSIFDELDVVFLNEKEHPVTRNALPDSYEELMRRNAKKKKGL